MPADESEPDRVLGYAHIDVNDITALVASMKPGEAVRIRPGELRRRVPVLAVEDDAWRAGIDA
jgi:hypothetical protein